MDSSVKWIWGGHVSAEMGPINIRREYERESPKRKVKKNESGPLSGG